jgi:hypothetical protein
MDTLCRRPHVRGMIRVTVTLDGWEVDVRLHPAYGSDAATAHALVALALVGAEEPLLIDECGRLHRFSPGSVWAFAVRKD